MSDVLSKSPAGGATEASPQSHGTGMMATLACRHPPPRLSSQGGWGSWRGGNRTLPSASAFFLLSVWLCRLFRYTHSKRAGEVLWSLTEPTFRSIINLGASSVSGGFKKNPTNLIQIPGDFTPTELLFLVPCSRATQGFSPLTHGQCPCFFWA